MQADIRQLLGQALLSIDAATADLVLNSMTEIERYPTQCFKSYQIYRIYHPNPYRPIAFYIGFAVGETVYILTGNPEDYIDCARADHIVIDTPEIAADYASTYLVTTRNPSELFYLVQSADEAKFFPNPDAEESEQIAAFLYKYRSVITPLSAKPVDSDFLVIVYAIRQQTLERHYLTVSRNGAIEVRIDLLERDLPLVYGL